MAARHGDHMYMRYAANMQRTTVLLPDDLAPVLRDAARRRHVTQTEIIRLALAAYLADDHPPRPRSLGMGNSTDKSVDSGNVKDWVHEEWDRRGRRPER